MKANKSASKTKRSGSPQPDNKGFYWRVRDVREDFRRRIEEMSSKSTLSIADRLRLAYYQDVLRLYASLSPETSVQSGATMLRHCSDHQEEAREINKILDYLVEEEEIKAGAVPQPGSIARALPPSLRVSPKKGRPVTRCSAALRALQLQIDTGRTWTSITQEVCVCKSEKHGRSCTENVRQSVNDLKRVLLQLGIQLPPRTRG
jgi:hypothetical protein